MKSKKIKSQNVDEFFAKFNPKLKPQALKIRQIIKKTLPEVVEKIKWGNPTYLVGSKNLAWILVYHDHIDFGFFQGAKLTYPLLEGTGKNLRHIKIYTSQDIKEAEFKKLLKQAVKLSN